MVQYNGINHLALVTCNMDDTITFWRDLLGMRLVAGLGKKGYRHYFFEVSETDLIAFFEWPDARPVKRKDHGVPQKGPVAFDHVAIGVETFADLVTLMKKLTAAGFWVSEIMDHGFIRSIYAFDPNNIPIEFSCITDVDIRGTPKMKDRQPSNITQLGPDPVPGVWPDFDENTHELPDIDVYPGEGVIFTDKNKKIKY